MHSTTQATTFRATAIFAAFGVVAALSSQLVPSVSAPVATTGATAAAAAVKHGAAAAVAAVTSATPAAAPAIRFAAPVAKAAVAFASDEALRARIKWVPIKFGGEKAKTLDDASRLLLAQAAAERAGLQQVGLSFQDVYGVIDAETSWVPRKGMGRNGVTSHGLAQFEPRTAKGLGLKNPNDPVQAVYAAAVNMKHGAEWAADKIAHLNLPPEQYAQKLREGVSVYYNLSVKGRNKWDGLNTAQLPVETQRHIQNVREGAEKAADLAQDVLG
jgi:soluble lytic murein transglycosylase-like protein